MAPAPLSLTECSKVEKVCEYLQQGGTPHDSIAEVPSTLKRAYGTTMNVAHAACYWEDNVNVLRVLDSFGADFFLVPTSNNQTAYMVAQMDSSSSPANLNYLKSLPGAPASGRPAAAPGVLPLFGGEGRKTNVRGTLSSKISSRFRSGTLSNTSPRAASSRNLSSHMTISDISSVGDKDERDMSTQLRVSSENPMHAGPKRSSLSPKVAECLPEMEEKEEVSGSPALEMPKAQASGEEIRFVLEFLALCDLKVDDSKLKRYATSLITHGYVNSEEVATLHATELAKIGFQDRKHVDKILSQAKNFV